MKSLPKWRQLFFSTGAISFITSIFIMVVGVHKAHQTTDYLEQARIAIPYIRWGTLFSLFSLLLSGFGRGWKKWVALVFSILFFIWWLLIAESIY